YLNIEHSDSESLISAPQREVFAELIFFVYNKKENEYFTIQDVEVKSFNALKTVCGLPQGNQCEFGIDVIVPSPLTNWEILSFNEKLQNPKFSWTVKNFSKLKEDKYASKSFSMGAMQWVLWLYPKGDSRADGKWLSLYLVLSDSNTLKADEKILTQANLRVLDPLRSNHLERKLNHWHNETNSGWGWNKFLSLAELRKSYLDTEDALTVEIEFEVVSATRYSPSI
ncbi:MATH domain and coiled-coil domain-containing protein At3g58200-like, partial [Brassica napus]|uniref:MATH domain and coiled-coil domain-containing protein At3g58200-like n=1 Tax=Brassica napus TaxID=3708 RepID=UPI002078A23F